MYERKRRALMPTLAALEGRVLCAASLPQPTVTSDHVPSPPADAVTLPRIVAGPDAGWYGGGDAGGADWSEAGGDGDAIPPPPPLPPITPLDPVLIGFDDPPLNPWNDGGDAGGADWSLVPTTVEPAPAPTILIPGP